MSLIDIILNGLAIYGALFVAGMVFSYPFKRFLESKYCTNPQKIYRRTMMFFSSIVGVALITEILTRIFSPPRSFDSISDFVWRHRRLHIPRDAEFADRFVSRVVLMVEMYPERLYIIFMVISIVVLLDAISKIKHESYCEYSKRKYALIGSLIIISGILFFNTSTIGWLSPSYITETPRYTSCGRWSYNMQFIRRHDRQYEPILFAREVSTGHVHRIQFWASSRVDSHDGPGGIWANLTPTDDPNIYVLTRTSQVNGVYTEYEIVFYGYPWLYGNGRERLVTPPEPIATGPFMYTYNRRFRYRLEDTYIKEGFRAWPIGPAIRLFVQDMETEAEHTFLLFIARHDDIRHSMLHEPIQLEPTDTPYLYIARFANGVDSFYINLAESTIERTGDSLYSPWRISEDGQIEYRLTISGRLGTGRVAPLTRYDIYLQMRCVHTGTELIVGERISETALRRYMSSSQAFDWVTIEPRQISEWELSWEMPDWWYDEGLHVVELRMPCGYPVQLNYDVSLIVDIHNSKELRRNIIWH